MHDDDQPKGRVLTRREILALLGGSGAALVAGLGLPRLVTAQTRVTPTPSVTPSVTPVPACVVRPELTEGPFFLEDMLNRSDVRVDVRDGSIKPGTALRLVYRVFDVTGGVCAPLAGAAVDIWHCDADGVYSGVRDGRTDTRGQTWLRGYQVTDVNGTAEFLTIIPGWYSGRAVHIHFKIRTDPEAQRGYEFTSQVFFDPEQIAEAYTVEPYASQGLPDVPNGRDFIYQQSGEALLVDLRPMTDEECTAYDVESGYATTFDIGLDLRG